MCGIAGILNIKTQTKELRDKALKMAQKIRHRGDVYKRQGMGNSDCTGNIFLFDEIFKFGDFPFRLVHI